MSTNEAKSMLIGYARVSTTQQDTDSQQAALEAAGCDEIYSEKVSGAAPLKDRTELQRALSALSEGDVFVVAKLDRIGRTMEDCVMRIAELLDRGCHVKTLDGRVDTKGLGKMAKMVVGILAAAAEIERDLILDRTAEGRERAKSRGVKFGRKRTYTDEQAATAKEFRENGCGYGAIGRRLGVSKSTAVRMCRT